MSPRISTAIQSVVYLPRFLSWVLVVTLFQQMTGGAGLIIQTLRQHGKVAHLFGEAGVYKRASAH